MFLVEKPILSSPFKSTSKKSHLIKSYQLAAISFDQKISHYLKTINLTSSSSITLTDLSNLISFLTSLTSLHTECESQILDGEMLGFYMEYSLKVLDLCNLMTSSVQKMTEKRMLFNFAVKLLMMMNSNGQVVQVEKMSKAKDVISRAVNGLTESSPEKITDSPEKGKSAKKLIDELTVMIGKLPEIKTVKNGRDLVARAFHALGVLTVVIGNVLVSVLFGDSKDESERVKVRVPAEFMWCDSVNEWQKVIFDQMKVNGNKVLEVDDLAKQAVIVRDLIDDAEGRVKLVEGVKDMEIKVKRFSDGVDALNSGVNGLFRTVLKTRNGRLDAIVVL